MLWAWEWKDVFTLLSFHSGIRIVSAAAGERHSVALAADGSMFTWGSGQHGQLGLEHVATYVEQVCKSPAPHGHVPAIDAPA